MSPRKFDGRGNYTFGVNDQSIFPEIELEKIKRTQGMDITIVTTAGENTQAHDLLENDGISVRGEINNLIYGQKIMVGAQ